MAMRGWMGMAASLFVLLGCESGEGSGGGGAGGGTSSGSGGMTTSGGDGGGGSGTGGMAACTFTSQSCAECLADVCDSTCTTSACTDHLPELRTCICAAQAAMDPDAAEVCLDDFRTKSPESNAYAGCVEGTCEETCVH